MKKVVLFVAVLMFAGAVTISAQEAKLEVALAGNASFTFGVNLDAVDPTDPTNADGTTKRVVATGINNAFQNKATLTILAANSYEKGGKEGEEVYGWIKLKEVKVSGEIDNTAIGGINNGDDDVTSPINVAVRNVEAKLFLGPVYINVLGVDNNIDKVGSITELFAAKTADVFIDIAEEFRGIALGLKDESVISLVVGVNSRLDFEDTSAVTLNAKVVPPGYTLDADAGEFFAAGSSTVLGGVVYWPVATGGPANIFNNYNVYAAVGLKAVPDLTLEASVAAGSATAANGDDSTSAIGFAAKAAYAIGLAEGIKLSPYAGLDFRTSTNTATDITSSGMQIAGGLNLSVPGAALDEWDVMGTGIDGADGVDINAGLTTVFSYRSVTESNLTEQADPNIDLGVYLYDADLIPVLNLIAVLEIANLTADTTIVGGGTSNMGWGVYAEAVLDQLKPWAAFYTKSHTAGGLDYDGVAVDSFVTTDYTALKIGVDITVITNTTFSISYTNTGLAKVLADGTKNSDVGTIKFTTKISY